MAACVRVRVLSAPRSDTPGIIGSSSRLRDGAIIFISTRREDRTPSVMARCRSRSEHRGDDGEKIL